MLPAQRVRALLSEHIGQVLTPELATELELASQSQRDKVDRLAGAMLTMPQADCPIEHVFAPGVCLRKITIPKGTVVVGVEHTRENLIVVCTGELESVTETGAVTVRAGDILRCQPGTANAVHALSDASWINVLVTDETDTTKIVEMFTNMRESDLLGGSTNAQLAANRQLELEI